MAYELTFTGVINPRPPVNPFCRIIPENMWIAKAKHVAQPSPKYHKISSFSARSTNTKTTWVHRHPVAEPRMIGKKRTTHLGCTGLFLLGFHGIFVGDFLVLHGINQPDLLIRIYLVYPGLVGMNWWLNGDIVICLTLGWTNKKLLDMAIYSGFSR